MNQERKGPKETTSYRASEELYQALFEQAADGIFITDPQGRYIAVNRCGCEMLGYSREELLNLSITDVIAPEDLTHNPLRLADLHAGKTVVSERRLRGKDGRLLPVEISAQMLSDGNLLGIVRDITKRKQTEEALWQSEQLLSKIFDTLPVGLWLADKNGQLVRSNPAGRKIWGIEGAEPLVGPTDYGIFKARRLPSGEEITPDDWGLAHTIKRGVTVRDELLEIDAFDGSKKVILHSTSPVLNDHDEVEAAVVVNLDITEREQTRRDLEQERAQLKTLIRTIPDLVWLKNPAGVYLACNPAFEYFFGAPESEIIGKTDYDFVETDQADFFRTKDRAAITAGGPSVNDEWVTFADNGRRVLLETIKTPLLDSAGQLMGVLGIARDVTAARQAEGVLRERVELQERLEKIAATAPGGLYSFLQRPNGTTCLPYVSPAWEAIHGLKAADVQHDASVVFELFHPGDRARVIHTIAESAQTMTPWQIEYRIITPHRGEVWVEGHSMPVREPDGTILWHGFITDITTRKRAEETRLVHQQIIESMDQVNRAIQGTNDLEQMMRDVLNTVSSIFDCDRAWLVYPCDPEAPSFRVPMEVSRPEYPGAGIQNINIPMDPDLAQNLQEALDAEGPVTYTAGTERPINRVTAEQFGVQSQMLVSIYPRLGKPWAFGIHQCSHPRLWTTAEKRLFQEFGRRLADALTSLLAHRNLRESENRYRRITEGLTDYQYSVRVENGRQVETTHSPNCAMVTGYTAEEFAADPYLWFRMVVPEDQKLVQEQVQQILAGTETPPIEHRIHRKDGEIRWVSNTAILFKHASGNILSYDGVIKDITERKQAEEAIRQSEEKYRFLFAHSPQIMWIYDLETLAFLEINQSAIDHYGYSREEFLAMTLADIRPAEDVPALLKDVEVTNRAYNFAGVWRHLKKNGEIIFVEIVSHSLTFNNRPARNVLVTDITERKQAEETLHLQSTALNAAANAILITNRAGLIQWANPAFGELTGYTIAETIGRSLRDLVNSGRQDQTFYQNLWNTILTGQVWRGEIVNRHKDGSLYIEEETITPVRNAHGEISHFVAIKQNISPRKALEFENQKLTEQFYQAQKMDSIGQLAGGIAHDFNNLLVPIVGFAELGMMATLSDSKLYSHFEQIKEAGDRAAGLTRQILAFSRRQMLEMKIIDLNQVIIEFEKMLQRLIGEDISLKTYLATNLPAIKADKGQLEQILLNLAVNARDAMPTGGRMTIETAQVVLDEAYAARHTGVQPGPYVRLTMSDTGHGMDAATQQRIFEPFFTTKPRDHGTGLGLSTVFGIVKQHGGNIWVYSEPGQGTTIKIYLPVTETLTPIPRTELPVDKPLGGTETILVIEDEAAVRELVSSTLRTYGYQVLEIGDPTRGLVMAGTYQDTIHLLLTDVIMPAMNGRELFQRLATDRRELKVLYMSGYTDDAIAHHGVLDEGVAFLQKPFTIRNLLEKVRAALG